MGAEDLPGGTAWFTGPADAPRRYAVTQVTVDSRVYRASTAPPAADSVALKNHGRLSEPNEESLRDRLERIAALGHPNLADHIEVFRGPPLHAAEPPPREEWDLVYSVSSWVEGRSLWAHRNDADGFELASLLRQLASALDALHSIGLVHGDVHPGNIVIGPSGSASLVDLDTTTFVGSTRAADHVGTVGFMPPEFDADHIADRRSDGWQLAMVVVQCLLGHPLGREGTDRLTPTVTRHLGRRRGARAAHALRSMLDPEIDRRPVDVLDWAEGLAAVLEVPAGRRVTRVAAGAAVLSVLVVAAVAAASVGDEDGNVERTTSAPPVIDLDCPLTGALDNEHERLLAATQDVVVAELGHCPSRVDTFVNALVIPDDDHGFVIVAPDETVVSLTDTQWSSYRETGGRTRPENAADIAGYPVEVIEDRRGVRIELSAGGVMIAAAPQDPPYWIPQQLRSFWEGTGGADGELGLPASHPFLYEGGLRQDFEHGEVSTTADAIFRPADQIDFEVEIPEDPAAPLTEVVPLRGRILRQRSGVAWYVDNDLRRHWIPDGEVFNCLGGDATLHRTDLPASAIWTLEVGPHASCAPS